MNTYTYKKGDFEQRPWGCWQVYDVFPSAVVKKIYIHPGGRLSYQRHEHRVERWIVVEGTATVTIDGKLMQLAYGESIEIPCRCLHRLANATDSNLVVIEIQYGNILSELDIERIDDDYSRIKTSDSPC